GPGELPLSATFGEGFIGYEAERQAVRLKFETQEALLGLGYEIGEIDGVIGTNTRKAIKDFQQTQGLKADGKTSAELVQQMRKVAQQKGLIRADTVAQ
ncbi:MAG: peptidoglycan-binding protein, partial [Gammaproteobacteria bacterium]|nr:peptidoglycan-binding protein [Gammaproteobacteria bacterium]